MNKFMEYKQLLSKSYDEAVDFLLEKYGAANDDYFREQSYERFFRDEIKKITKGKFSKSDEGLECHHIAENQFFNMTNERYVKQQQIPFDYHKKEKLVFADVIEHAILHVLIAKETSLDFGYPGYNDFLRPKVEEWYVKKIIPQKSKHHIACYNKAYIESKEAIELLKITDHLLSNETEKRTKKTKCDV